MSGYVWLCMPMYDYVGLCMAVKGGGRPPQLLPHAKMLLIPIQFFFSAG